MKKGHISKAIVVKDDKTGGTVLAGVAETHDEKVNFRVKYDWDTMDIPGFLEDMRNELAKGLDVAASQMEIFDRQLLGKMKKFHLMLKASN